MNVKNNYNIGVKKIKQKQIMLNWNLRFVINTFVYVIL